MKLKELLQEDIKSSPEYFNNNNFKISKNFPNWYIKKYGDDPRFEPRDWVGKSVKIYRVKLGDKSIQAAWRVKYKIFNDYDPRWSLIIPISDIVKYKLFDQR